MMTRVMELDDTFVLLLLDPDTLLSLTTAIPLYDTDVTVLTEFIFLSFLVDMLSVLRP